MASYKPSFKFADGPLAPGASKKPFKAKSVRTRMLPIFVRATDLLMIRTQLHSIRNQVDHPSEKQMKYIKHNLLELQRMVESVIKDSKRSMAVERPGAWMNMPKRRRA